ncbi:MAG: insulinase family protein [Hyphomicrobiales bacterium]|nr:insulinase family protein [Hyphomicrobiales bacterium]
MAGVFGRNAITSADAAAPIAEIPLVGGDISTFTLNNGLDVVVIPDHRVPVVTHMVWYRVGSADEPAGKSGIAHFLEHLMFKGTEKHGVGEFSDTVARVGGQENAFTSDDYTGYFQRVAKQHLRLVMELESDRMANLKLTDEVVLPERDVVLEERRSRVDNDPSALLGEAVDAALYIHHPYGTPIIGWENEITKLNRADAVAFYERFYTPNNAILIVAGDVEADEVRTLAEETYGKLARRAEPGVRDRPQEPKPLAARRVELTDKRVGQPNLRRSYLVPSYTRAEPGEAEALDVLAQILGGGSTSRLYRALVVEEGNAAAAGGWYQGSAYDMTRLALYAVPRQGVALAELETTFDKVIAEIKENGVTEEELERAKRTIIAEALYAQDSQASLARIFGAALTTGSSIEAVQTWPRRVGAVTAADVKAAAEKYLVMKRSVTGYLRKPANDDRS